MTRRRGSRRLEGEAGDVDEPQDIAGVSIDIGDDRTTVGVPGEHHGPVDAADQVGERGGIGSDAAQRIRPGDDAVSFGYQRRGDAVPARRAGVGAMDEDDCGLHATLLGGVVGPC